jgi:hypothetical protein
MPKLDHERSFIQAVEGRAKRSAFHQRPSEFPDAPRLGCQAGFTSLPSLARQGQR